MWKLFSIVLLQWVLISEGFYFRTELDWEAETDHEPKAEITDKCLQYSKDYDCRFYDCLNQRFPCGESSRKGKARAHCVKSKERAHKLTDVGKIWINNIIKCFVKEMTEVYKRPSLDCTKGNAMVMGIQQRCYTSNDFCNVGWEHRKELWNIFNEPITSSKSHFYKMMWKNIGNISAKCNTPTSDQLVAWINAHFVDARMN